MKNTSADNIVFTKTRLPAGGIMANEHILVVEDEEDILELLRYNLTKEGFRVTGVTSGEEALRSAKTLLPDLVLLDLMLPGMDGLEICRHLKQDNRTQHLPV